MNKNKQGMIIPLVVLGLLLITAIGYWFFKNFKKDKEISGPIPSPTISEEKPSPTSTPQPDPILEWNTYQNQKYNYQFKYPPDSKLSDQSDEYVAASFMGEKQRATGRTQTELFDGYAFNVVNVTEGGYGDLDDFFIQKVNQLKDVCSSISNPRETTVSGRRAITHKLNCLGDYDAYYVKNGDEYFEISLLHVGDEADLPTYTKTVNKIFSTFQFTQ
ncbi:hypothetical protein ACFLZP_01975 [Patescibacteria group bacterium]